MIDKISIKILLVICIAVSLSACSSNGSGNRGNMPSYAFGNMEAEWIRNGEPVEFEGQQWYPEDGIESLTDMEVYPISEYRGVKIFVDKTDVRPFDRLYTKFGVNKYRYFEPKSDL